MLLFFRILLCPFALFLSIFFSSSSSFFFSRVIRAWCIGNGPPRSRSRPTIPSVSYDRCFRGVFCSRKSAHESRWHFDGTRRNEKKEKKNVLNPGLATCAFVSWPSARQVNDWCSEWLFSLGCSVLRQSVLSLTSAPTLGVAIAADIYPILNISAQLHRVQYTTVRALPVNT